MYLSVPAKFYVYLFIPTLLGMPLFVGLPLLLSWKLVPFYMALEVVNTLLLVFVWWSVSSARMSFLKGLEIVAGANMSGCVNLTMIYLLPVLLMAYGVAALNAVVGLKKGKAYAEQKWVEEVARHEAVQRRW